MAYRGDLAKIGAEGFAALENGKKMRLHPRPQHQYQDPYPFWEPKVTPVKEAVIDCNRAAQKYGGVLVREYGKKPLLRKAY